MTLFGVPSDHLSTRITSLLPRSILNFGLESLVTLQYGDLGKYGLKPSHHFMEAHPTVNSDILNRINSGKIIVKPNITHFTESSVYFEDGTNQEIDAVIYCTGYTISHPFLDSQKYLGQTECDPSRVSLYKHIFSIKYPSLAFIGLVQPFGAIMPVSEMQARWVARIFSNQGPPLPSKQEMRDECDREWLIQCKRFIPRERHTIEVEYVAYMDMIASLVGCQPDLWALWMSNWSLAAAVTFGPTVPSQYRLRGPGSWKDAEITILEACKGYDFQSLFSKKEKE